MGREGGKNLMEPIAQLNCPDLQHSLFGSVMISNSRVRSMNDLLSLNGTSESLFCQVPRCLQSTCFGFPTIFIMERFIKEMCSPDDAWFKWESGFWVSFRRSLFSNQYNWCYMFQLVVFLILITLRKDIEMNGIGNWGKLVSRNDDLGILTWFRKAYQLDWVSQ
jgi:hypothetical protein